MNANEIGWR